MKRILIDLMTMNAQERRAYIIKEIESGRKQVDVARELGVTRAAVSAIWRRYETKGEAFLKAPGKGRQKERDTLTDDEVSRVVQFLDGHRPQDVGIDEPRWKLLSVKRAILQLLNKRVNLAVAHSVYHAEGWSESIEFAEDEEARTVSVDESDEMGVEAPIKRKRGRPVGSGMGGLPSLEEMQRSNETIKEQLASNPKSSYGLPAHGVRTGKRAKGKGSPVQKKRKKKRK